MITNDECKVIELNGLLNGLKSRLDSLIRISNDDNYRGDLTDEIKRVEDEIVKTKKILNK